MNPNLVDIHCHLDFKDFDPVRSKSSLTTAETSFRASNGVDDDRDAVISRALDAGIWMINIGIDAKTSQKAIEIAEKYEGVFASVGLHPSEAEENFDLDYYRQLAKHPKAVAIGECGLDLKSPAEGEARQGRQKEIFIKQIELALEVNKPLMIHCREAHKEIIDIVSSFKFQDSRLRGNIHFFSGSWEEAQQYFDLGFAISFTGVITFTRDYDEVIKNAPLDKIMIETDAPFARPLTPERSDGGWVAPVPFRGKRNEPLYVREVAKKIAEIKGVNYEEVAQITTANALKLFNL